jgi:hypothetical protein
MCPRRALLWIVADLISAANAALAGSELERTWSA